MIALRVEAGVAAVSVLHEIKQLAARYPGEHDLVLRASGRELRLGPSWRYAASEGCLAALSEFGAIEPDDQPRDGRQGPPVGA